MENSVGNHEMATQAASERAKSWNMLEESDHIPLEAEGADPLFADQIHTAERLVRFRRPSTLNKPKKTPLCESIHRRRQNGLAALALNWLVRQLKRSSIRLKCCRR
jgi:hypothetical protein